MEPFKPDVMLQQVADLGNLLKTEFLNIDKNVLNAFKIDELKQFQAVYPVGDGDSLHAALAAEMAFGELAGIAYYPRPAMRFLEYGADLLQQEFPFTPLVLGISASGSSTRVVEALERVKSRNAEIKLAAMVGNPVSRVADSVKTIISVQIPNMGASPGIRTYAASLMGLFALAIRIGEAKGRLSNSEVHGLHKEIIGLADVIDRTANDAVETAKIAAKDLKQLKFISSVGSGPSFGTAIFSSAKIVEAAGVFAAGQDLEEWAHVEGLAYPLDYPVFLIAPPGKGYWRAEKLASYISMLGHPIIAVLDQKDSAIKEKASYVFKLMGAVRECLSPLVTHIPADLFACYLAKELGRLPFMLDIQEKKLRSEIITRSIKTGDSDEI